MCTDIGAKKGRPRTSQVNTGVSPVAPTLGADNFTHRSTTSGGYIRLSNDVNRNGEKNTSEN